MPDIYKSLVEARIRELESKITPAMEDRYRTVFDRRSSYKGNGIYSMGRHYSIDTRELFLMFVADMEDIEYAGKIEEIEEEVS